LSNLSYITRHGRLNTIRNTPAQSYTHKQQHFIHGHDPVAIAVAITQASVGEGHFASGQDDQDRYND
jgi:hypothetical protein